MSTSNMTRGRRRWVGGSAASPEKNRYEDDRGQDHRRRCELRLAQSRKDAGVGPQVAQEEPARGVDAEVDQAERAVRQASLEPLVKRKQQPQDSQAQHHLVRDLRMHDLARLTQRIGVDVLDAPRKGRRRPVMLTVDDVADAADGVLPTPEADAGGGHYSKPRELAVPGDEQGPDFQDVRVKVDDDAKRHHAARSSRDNATSFGSSANA